MILYILTCYWTEIWQWLLLKLACLLEDMLCLTDANNLNVTNVAYECHFCSYFPTFNALYLLTKLSQLFTLLRKEAFKTLCEGEKINAGNKHLFYTMRYALNLYQTKNF